MANGICTLSHLSLQVLGANNGRCYFAMNIHTTLSVSIECPITRSWAPVRRSSPIVDLNEVLCLLTAENNLSASQLVTGMMHVICKSTTKFRKRSLLYTFSAYNRESGGACIFRHLTRHTSNSVRRLLTRENHLCTSRDLLQALEVRTHPSLRLLPGEVEHCWHYACRRGKAFLHLWVDIINKMNSDTLFEVFHGDSAGGVAW